MSLKKLSILLFNSILLFSCSGNIFADKETANKIFVDDISEKRGMIIRNSLLEYFPNKDNTSSIYIIKVSSSLSEEFYLTTSAGFGSKKRIRINVIWELLHKSTQTSLLKINNTYMESYNIEANGQSNYLNRDITIDTLARRIAKDIAFKSFSLLTKIKNNPDFLNEKLKISSNSKNSINK